MSSGGAVFRGDALISRGRHDSDDRRRRRYRWRGRLSAIGASIVLALAGVGCEVRVYPGIATPAPLAESFPFEIENGRRLRGWGGDRFELIHEGTLHFICLQGVWAPEAGQPGFSKSRSHLSRLLRGKLLRVVIAGRDEYAREFGRVFQGEDEINIAMLRSGWARVDDPPAEVAPLYEAAEREAQQAGRGLWGLKRGAPSKPGPPSPQGTGQGVPRPPGATKNRQ